MCEIKPAWQYWHEADVRTIKVIDGITKNIEIKKIPMMRENSIAHNALDDAKNQAFYVVDILQKINKK